MASRSGILNSVVIVIALSLLAKIVGYLEKIVLAYYFGIGPEVDAYFLVFGIVFSIFVVMRELIEPGYLVTFISSLGQGNPIAAWKLFNTIGTLLFLVLVLFLIIGLSFPGAFIELFAPGFEGKRKFLAIKIFKLAVPGILFSFTVCAYIYYPQWNKTIFFVPALGDLALKLGIVLTILLLYSEAGTNVLGWAILTGAISRLTVHLFSLWNKIKVKWIEFKLPQLQQVKDLTLPLIIGVIFSQLSVLVDNAFASNMTTGSLSSLSYAKKIIDLPIIVVPYALGIVVFPFFSELASRGQKGLLFKLFSGTMTWIIMAFIPLAVLTSILASPIINVLLERGAFDATSTAMTSLPLSIFAVGLPAFAVETILVLLYFSMKDTKTPVYTGILFVCINILLTWAFIQYIDYLGIAWATVISKTMKTLVLLYLLKNKFEFDRRPTIRFLAKVFFAGCSMAIVVFIGDYLFFESIPISKIKTIAYLSVISVTGLTTFFLFGYFLGLQPRLDQLKVQ